MSDGRHSSLTASVIAALEGSTSVLLTLLAGYLVGRAGLLDHTTVKRLSSLCSQLFLPCLIIVEMGPELTADNLHRFWIIPVWGLVSTTIAHLVGWAGQAALQTPYWVIVAAGRPNTSAMPLLLLQALDNIGILAELTHGVDETVSSSILSRARSLILLNVIIQQTLTFQVAPFILRKDAAGKSIEESGPSSLTPAVPIQHASHINPLVQDPERVGLLQDTSGPSYGSAVSPVLDPVADSSPPRLPRTLERIAKPLTKVLSVISAPLSGAIIALVIGITPPLHRLAFDEEGVFYNTVTESVQNLGELYVTLQMFIVGAELATIPNAFPGVLPTSWAMFTRFIVMPAVSLLFVWATAGRGWYVNDELVWFILVLMPSGPSAMLLASIAELVDVDQGPIASYLTISYLFSPLMAVICSLGLFVVHDASKRLP